MQFAAQYMAETLHRHESNAATELLERRRRAEDDVTDAQAEPAPRGWASWIVRRAEPRARLAHR